MTAAVSEQDERFWLNSYEDHVNSDVEPEYKSLVEYLENIFASFGNKPAYSCMGATIPFDRLDQYSREMAAYFQNRLGLKKGDRVAIMLPNILQYPIALFGALRAGLTVVNVNPLYTPRELEHQLKDSGAETIIILENFAYVLEEVVGNTPIKNVITTEVADQLGFPKSIILNVLLKYVLKKVPKFNLPGRVSFNQCLGEGAGLEYRKPDVGADDLAFLQYTGGTTGVSKGAMLSHGNIIINVAQAGAWISGRTEKGTDIIITALPLYHIFSLTANCFVFSGLGAHNILIPNPRDIPKFISELKKWQFTAFTGVNTLFNGLLANAEFSKVDFSRLKCTLGGGMAVQKVVAEKWESVTGQPLIQAYGLTETSPAAIINPFSLGSFNGSIGLPLPSTYVTIRDDDGAVVPNGEAGEIWIKGPQVMQGYWNRPDETAKTIEDGWLKTGDVAVMDDQGFVTIVDRKKDMILVSGFNVYPNEIEAVVAEHPGVLEAAAIGVPDSKSGEAIKVFCVKSDPNITSDDLIAHCRKGLTGYKVPKVFEFREDLPKTNVGKILRRALRDS